MYAGERLFRKSSEIRRQTISSILLGQETVNREEIAQNPNAFLTGVRALCNVLCGLCTIGDVSEHFQFHGRFHGECYLVSAQCPEETEWIGLGRRSISGHDVSLQCFSNEGLHRIPTARVHALRHLEELAAD
jgi:hypothetical protein